MTIDLWRPWMQELPARSEVFVRSARDHAGSKMGRPRTRERTQRAVDLEAWEAGDKLGDLRLPEYLTNREKVKPSYAASIEGELVVVLDPSRVLRRDPAASLASGLVAVGLAAMALLDGVRVRLSLRASSPGWIVRSLPALRSEAAAWQSVDAVRGDSCRARVQSECRSGGANRGLVVLTHVGWSPTDFADLLRLVSSYPWASLILPVASRHEFANDGVGICARSGRAVRLPRHPAEAMAGVLDEMVGAGERSGVLVRPLVVTDPESDSLAALRSLA